MRASHGPRFKNCTKQEACQNRTEILTGLGETLGAQLPYLHRAAEEWVRRVATAKRPSAARRLLPERHNLSKCGVSRVGRPASIRRRVVSRWEP